LFEWRILYNQAISRDTVKITIETPPTVASAGPDRTLCSVTETFLEANMPVVGTGTWRVLLGPATLTNANNPGTAVTGLQVGDNDFEWSIASTASCPVSRDTVRISVDALPSVADAGPDDETCNPTEILAGVRPIVGSGLWTVLVGPATLDDPTDHNATASGLQPGLNQFEWTVSNGVCPVSRDTVNITLTLAPVSNFSFTIQGLSVQFTSLAQNAETYSWNFGDGTSSTQQNPSHLYSVIRSFRVTHTVTNDCGTNSKRIRVSLTGAAGILNIPQATVDFGEVAVGSTVMDSIALANIGTDTLDIEPLYSDILGSVFTYAIPEVSLAPGADTSFIVTFTPDSDTELSSPIAVVANDTSATVLLHGTGITPPEVGHDNDSRGAIEFGEIIIGESAVREITLMNSQSAPMAIETVSILGDDEFMLDAGSFRVTRRPSGARGRLVDGELSDSGKNPLPVILGYGDSITVLVLCTPTTEDSSGGTLRFVANKEAHDIALRARGVVLRNTETRGANDSATVTGETPSDVLPDVFELEQNYPNPFNSTTNIRFSLKEAAHVTIRVYDALGQEISTLIDDQMPEGFWQTTWEGRDNSGAQVSSGIYIYKIQTEGFVQARRMILLR
jgi:PKD repeat protein